MQYADEHVCSLKQFMIFESDFDEKWEFEKSKIPSILKKFNMQGNEELNVIESFEIDFNGNLMIKMVLGNTPIYLIRLTVIDGNWGYLH